MHARIIIYLVELSTNCYCLRSRRETRYIYVTGGTRNILIIILILRLNVFVPGDKQPQRIDDPRRRGYRVEGNHCVYRGRGYRYSGKAWRAAGKRDRRVCVCV